MAPKTRAGRTYHATRPRRLGCFTLMCSLLKIANESPEIVSRQAYPQTRRRLRHLWRCFAAEARQWFRHPTAMSVRNHPQMVRRAPIRAFERDGSLMAQAPFERKALISRLKASDALKAKTNFSSLDTPKGLTVRLLIRRSAPGPRRSRNDVRDSRILHFLVERGQVCFRNALDLCGCLADQRRQFGQFFLLLAARSRGETVQVVQQALHLIGERLGFPLEGRSGVPQPLPRTDVLLGDRIHF